MKGIYEMVHSRMTKPFLLKENTFLFTDLPLNDQNLMNYYSRLTIKSSSLQNLPPGYGGAQYRFIESLFIMLELKRIRNDSKVRWFFLSDDDHLMIPTNYLKVIAKYEFKLKSGEISMEEPLIIGRIPSCSQLSGGPGIIFNEKAIELLKFNFDNCLDTFGLAYYDLTIYKCINHVITKSREEKCKILRNENSMHCCNFMFYCDPASFNDVPNLSWFTRFRNGSNLHYIQGQNVKIMRDSLPDQFFTQVNMCFRKSEVENTQVNAYLNFKPKHDLTIEEIINRVKQLGKKPFIDWAKKESQQMDHDRVSNYMKNLVDIIYTSWGNQYMFKRHSVSTLQRNDISIIIIPSSLIDSRSKLISNDYDMKRNVNLALQFWRNEGFTQVYVCDSDIGMSQISMYATCLKNSKGLWTVGVTESTRIHSDSFIEYLETFDNSDSYFIGGMSSALELILSQVENKIIGLPFGALFSISKPFLNDYIATALSHINDPIKQQQVINEKLLIPNSKMMLSGGQFFKHAPEHYCTGGIQNLESWVEMQIPTQFLEPMAVTLSPTNNCPSRLDTIHYFFEKKRFSLNFKSDINEKCFER
ncbi:predicted protein [Naegleria gruberi]|uniref:Predicted protein n=1 Tax=Naegleria gruberi TaxID=5762 RepID=D2VL15_NAEGR|nr:uncharacterized protein NAEGRDRAFT_69627 [Naegleria gruberi]EFC42543.1 predicted protein [Naegleria gruberi]|eukprot:XP_002675287.1 predicted protein [Naegleria gruberi strain NEG-M]